MKKYKLKEHELKGLISQKKLNPVFHKFAPMTVYYEFQLKERAESLGRKF